MILAFGYKKGVGKDTAANYLLKNYGFKRVANADRLKYVAGLLYGLTADQLYGHLKEVVDPRWNITPREILQRLGHLCRVNIHLETWTRPAMEIADQLSSAGAHVVFTDGRYPDELELVKTRKGLVIRLDRDVPTNEFSNDSSETSLDNYTAWNYIIDNNGTPEELHERLDDLMKSLGIKRI